MRVAFADLDRRVEKLIDRCLESAVANEQNFRLDAVLLAGQGSKIYTVAEVVRRKFPHQELVESLHEKSVLCGLAYQSGVMAGKKRDLLMIDTLYRPLLLRCMARENKDGVQHITLSCKSAGNTSYVNVGLRDVPSIVELKAKISGSGTAVLVFLEASTADPNNRDPTGEVILEKVSDGETYTVKIDIDANRVIHVMAVSSANQIIVTRVLNRT